MKGWIAAAIAVGVAAFAYVAPVTLLIVLPTAVTLGLVAWAMWGRAGESPSDDTGTQRPEA